GHGLINVHPLASEASMLNLMDNTRFTVPTVVNDAIIGYPASASIQLMIYKENTASAQCSGSMVAPNLVLTAAHCLIDQDTHTVSLPARNYEPESAPGRRLHYNYGLVDVLGPELLGINSGSAVATGGQSGSPLFYMEEANPYIVGVSIYSRLYQHQRITKKIL